MFRTAETDAFRTEVKRGLRLIGLVGICADAETFDRRFADFADGSVADFVAPFHKGAEVAGDLRLFCRDLSGVYVARRTVDRKPVTLPVRFAVDGDGAV